MAFQILSLSGGGYFGLFTAVVLEDFEKRAGVPLHRCFDLIAGTSIGGMIALAIGSGQSAARIRAMIEEHGTKVFGEEGPPRSKLAKLWKFKRSVLKPLYSDTALRNLTTDLLGSKTIGELSANVIVPGVNLTKGRATLFKTPHHPTFQYDWKIPIVDAAMATAAAPTYFPIAQVGESLYADGGLFANSPDFLAVHDAIKFLGAAEQDISVLSIGTTTGRFSFSHEAGRDFGVWNWGVGGRLVNVIISAQQQVTHDMMRHRFGDERYVRIDIDKSPEQDRDLAIDVANKAAQQTIAGLADAALREAAKLPSLSKFFAHRAAPLRFHYGPQAQGVSK